MPGKGSPGPARILDDFPAEHWKHLRTSNPIQSTFATVRHRTIRSKGCLSNRTALAHGDFKLVMRRRKAGGGSMATTSCPSSFKVSGSLTGSSPPTRRPRNPKPPPPEPLDHHQNSAIALVGDERRDLGFEIAGQEVIF